MTASVGHPFLSLFGYPFSGQLASVRTVGLSVPFVGTLYAVVLLDGFSVLVAGLVHYLALRSFA